MSNNLLNVHGTAAHVLSAWADSAKSYLGNFAVIFDDQLSYETSQILLRQNDSYSSQQTDGMPMLSYKRTQLMRIEDRIFGLRYRNAKVVIPNSDGNYDVYDIAFMEFDLMFAVFTKDAQTLESFEVTYGSDSGLTALKTLSVDLPVIGAMSYIFRWENLESFEVNPDDGNFFKSVIGSAKVRGFYFTFTGVSKRITDITGNIISSSNLSQPNLDENISQCIINSGT